MVTKYTVQYISKSNMLQNIHGDVPFVHHSIEESFKVGPQQGNAQGVSFAETEVSCLQCQASCQETFCITLDNI